MSRQCNKAYLFEVSGKGSIPCTRQPLYFYRYRNDAGQQKAAVQIVPGNAAEQGRSHSPTNATLHTSLAYNMTYLYVVAINFEGQVRGIQHAFRHGRPLPPK